MFEIATYDMHRNKGYMRASGLAKNISNSFFRLNRLNWKINLLIIAYFAILFDKFSMAESVLLFGSLCNYLNTNLITLCKNNRLSFRSAYSVIIIQKALLSFNFAM